MKQLFNTEDGIHKAIEAKKRELDAARSVADGLIAKLEGMVSEHREYEAFLRNYERELRRSMATARLLQGLSVAIATCAFFVIFYFRF